MAETGWRRGRALRGGRTELLTRPGAGELSLVDPMGPPPSVVTRRGTGPEVTPDRLGLSSPTAPWRASDEGSCQGRHVLTPCAPRGVARAHRGSGCHGLPRRIHPARPGSALPAGVSSEIATGWNEVDGGWRTLAQLACRGTGPIMERWVRPPNGRRWKITSAPPID